MAELFKCKLCGRAPKYNPVKEIWQCSNGICEQSIVRFPEMAWNKLNSTAAEEQYHKLANQSQSLYEKAFKDGLKAAKIIVKREGVEKGLAEIENCLKEDE